MAKLKLKAGGHFLLVKEYEIEEVNSTNKLVMPDITQVEEYKSWQVLDVGDLVGKGDDPNGINERFQNGDILFAQPSKVNVIRFQGSVHYLVDEEFCLKVILEEDNV